MNRVARQPRFTPAALLFACLVWSCAGDDPPVRPPNVVIIVLDTVRADHLSSYGYDLPTTPHIDELCETAVRYTRCRATGPWTLPSHASIFTGRFAFQHRARTEIDENGELQELPLNLEHRTLAEALGELGYRTGAFVANAAYLREEYQLDQGFGHYLVQREPGLAKNAAAFEWLAEVDGPFFLFLNYMDAHRPYNTRPVNGERAAQFSSDGIVHTAMLLDELYAEVMRDGREASDEIVGELTKRYDAGLANADLAVGAVIAHLREKELWDDTVFIVTSDHGEFFGEHRLVEHSKDVYEEVLHVPLICRLPGMEAGSVNTDLVSLADLPGLVAQALPDELADRVQEQFPLQLQRDFSIAEISFSRSKDLQAAYGGRFMRERKVIYSGPYKLIRSSDGMNELYDLDADAEERNNLFDTKPKLAKRLSNRLQTYMHEHPGNVDGAAPVVLNLEATAVLRDLGYVGDVEGEDGSADDSAEGDY